MTRDELIEKCENLLYWRPNANDLVDFIIEDRKRIVDPLVKYNKCYPSYAAMEAINHTLKNAGMAPSS